MTNFSSLTVGGLPVLGGGGIPATKGTVFFVDYGSGSDGNSGTKISEPFKTVDKAYDMATTNMDDVIVLMGSTTHTLSEMLTVSKNRIHFVGMDGTGGRFVQQNAKMQIGVTGVATDLAPVLVTGVRNSFVNIKFINASTTNQTLYGFIDNGEGTYIDSCHMVKTAGLDDASWASFWMAGDSLTMKNCVLGQSNIPSGVAHFGILIDGKTGGASDTVKENFLENIYINMSVSTAAAATACFIKVADGSALNFNNVIKNLNAVNFVQAGTGTIMTDAVLGAATTGGYLHLINPSFMGCTGVGAGSGQGIYISAGGLAPDANGGLGTELTD
jgi:hypothetical protein